MCIGGRKNLKDCIKNMLPLSLSLHEPDDVVTTALPPPSTFHSPQIFHSNPIKAITPTPHLELLLPFFAHTPNTFL